MLSTELKFAARRTSVGHWPKMAGTKNLHIPAQLPDHSYLISFAHNRLHRLTIVHIAGAVSELILGSSSILQASNAEVFIVAANLVSRLSGDPEFSAKRGLFFAV